MTVYNILRSPNSAPYSSIRQGIIIITIRYTSFVFKKCIIIYPSRARIAHGVLKLLCVIVYTWVMKYEIFKYMMCKREKNINITKKKIKISNTYIYPFSSRGRIRHDMIIIIIIINIVTIN